MNLRTVSISKIKIKFNKIKMKRERDGSRNKGKKFFPCSAFMRMVSWLQLWALLSLQSSWLRSLTAKPQGFAHGMTTLWAPAWVERARVLSVPAHGDRPLSVMSGSTGSELGNEWRCIACLQVLNSLEHTVDSSHWVSHPNSSQTFQTTTDQKTLE